MDEIKQTQATYAQIATIYAAQRHDRTPIQKQMTRFMTLVPTGSTVLDIGCGPGFDTAVLRQNGYQAIGADYARPMMLAGRDEYNLHNPYVQLDMRHMPFAQQIDAIWASASLLHLPPHALLPTLIGFNHILYPNGLLCCSLKHGQGTHWSLISYNQPSPRFFTFWQADTFDPLLTQAGFTIIDGWLHHTPNQSWLIRFAQKIT